MKEKNKAGIKLVVQILGIGISLALGLALPLYLLPYLVENPLVFASIMIPLAAALTFLIGRDRYEGEEDG